jgi:hypothetical protein
VKKTVPTDVSYPEFSIRSHMVYVNGTFTNRCMKIDVHTQSSKMRSVTLK